MILGNAKFNAELNQIMNDVGLMSHIDANVSLKGLNRLIEQKSTRLELNKSKVSQIKAILNIISTTNTNKIDLHTHNF